LAKEPSQTTRQWISSAQHPPQQLGQIARKTAGTADEEYLL
jgi:hypothetical protein